MKSPSDVRGRCLEQKSSAETKRRLICSRRFLFLEHPWCVDERKRIMSTATPSLRVDPVNPNHHLWNNHGTWWVHYTLHLPDYTKQRIRKNLSTRSLKTARTRRDSILTALAI